MELELVEWERIMCTAHLLIQEWPQAVVVVQAQVTPCEPLVSSLLQPPLSPCSACGAPPLRNHSICVPYYSLIGAISQTQFSSSHIFPIQAFKHNRSPSSEFFTQQALHLQKYNHLNTMQFNSKAWHSVNSVLQKAQYRGTSRQVVGAQVLRAFERARFLLHTTTRPGQKPMLGKRFSLV